MSGRRSSAPLALRLLWCILGHLGLGPCWSCEGLSLHAAKLGRLSMATPPTLKACVCSGVQLSCQVLWGPNLHAV